MNNKHLINACRYLDAVHDVSINEGAHNLPDLVRNIMKGMECSQIKKYWYYYLSETNPEFKDGLMKLVEKKREVDSNERISDALKRKFFYRDAKQLIFEIENEVKKEQTYIMTDKATLRNYSV
jgi:hypothetical protein